MVLKIWFDEYGFKGQMSNWKSKRQRTCKIKSKNHLEPSQSTLILKQF